MGTSSGRELFRPSWPNVLLGRMARPSWWVGQAMLIGLVLLAGCLAISGRAGVAPTSDMAAGRTTLAVTAPGDTTTAGTVVPIAREDLRPTQIAVPRVGIRTSVIGLGTAKDGSLEVPADFGVAGWYAGGPPRAQPARSARGSCRWVRSRETSPARRQPSRKSSGRP